MKLVKLHSSTDENSNRPLMNNLFHHRLLVLLLILVLSFGLWVFRLDLHSLWYDEANTAHLLQHKSVSGGLEAILATSGSETLHPLYYLILSAWMQVAGDSELALRFPSVVFGSCAAVVYALLLYQVGGTKAFPFSLLLAVSPFLMWYSRDARPYALIMFLTGMHLLFYLKLLIKPKSKMALAAFMVTGILSIYSGILTGVFLIAELLCSLFVRRRPAETVAISVVILFAIPLILHGWRIHFVKSSDRYYELPKKMNAVRAIGIPQEFLVGRSFGPTPDEVRQLSPRQVLGNKSIEISVEALAIVSIFVAFLASLRYLHRNSLLRNLLNEPTVRIIGFITVACIIQVALLILTIAYRTGARHIAFLFGPLFALAILPIACSNKKSIKIAFVLPLLILWTWSCANQILDSSYEAEDYRGAAKVITNERCNTSQIIALCNPRALRYYGVDKPLAYLREAPDVSCDTLATYMTNGDSLVWVVLSRPWNYSGFESEKLQNYFQVLRTEQFPGIRMWLLAPANTKIE